MDKGEAPPGNAGVPPASLFLAGGRGASARRCRQAATLPPDPARSCLQASSITPPLRGSRREGEARLRAGGGPTRRPKGMPPRGRGRPARTMSGTALPSPPLGSTWNRAGDLLLRFPPTGRLLSAPYESSAPAKGMRHRDAGGTPGLPGGASGRPGQIRILQEAQWDFDVVNGRKG